MNKKLSTRENAYDQKSTLMPLLPPLTNHNLGVIRFCAYLLHYWKIIVFFFTQ